MVCTAAVASLAFGVYAATPVFRHRFDSAKDDSGRHTGQAMSGAVLTKIGNEGIVDLGTAGGWFDFGTSLGDIIRNLKGDYAIVANLMIPSTTSLGANGNFIFNFGQSSSGGYAFLGANQSRYSISKTSWSGEQTVSPDMRFPQGGSLATYAFREGVYVFYRDGKYYFLWSVDDTGARNYHVAYGTSDSPMGPIKVAEDPIVLVQDGNNEIYGTGHNSVIQIPGRDEWYIVYHRINKKFVSKGPVSTSSYTLNGVRISGEPRTSGVYVSLDSDGNDRSQGSKLMK